MISRRGSQSRTSATGATSARVLSTATSLVSWLWACWGRMMTLDVPDKRTLSRALKLRDAALSIREVVEGWQPERRIMVVYRGAFRISYREPGLLLPLR